WCARPWARASLQHRRVARFVGAMDKRALWQYESCTGHVAYSTWFEARSGVASTRPGRFYFVPGRHAIWSGGPGLVTSWEPPGLEISISMGSPARLRSQRPIAGGTRFRRRVARLRSFSENRTAERDEALLLRAAAILGASECAAVHFPELCERVWKDGALQQVQHLGELPPASQIDHAADPLNLLLVGELLLRECDRAIHVARCRLGLFQLARMCALDTRGSIVLGRPLRTLLQVVFRSGKDCCGLWAALTDLLRVGYPLQAQVNAALYIDAPVRSFSRRTPVCDLRGCIDGALASLHPARRDARLARVHLALLLRRPRWSAGATCSLPCEPDRAVDDLPRVIGVAIRIWLRRLERYSFGKLDKLHALLVARGFRLRRSILFLRESLRLLALHLLLGRGRGFALCDQPVQLRTAEQRHQSAVRRDADELHDLGTNHRRHGFEQSATLHLVGYRLAAKNLGQPVTVCRRRPCVALRRWRRARSRGFLREASAATGHASREHSERGDRDRLVHRLLLVSSEIIPLIRHM